MRRAIHRRRGWEEIRDSLPLPAVPAMSGESGPDPADLPAPVTQIRDWDSKLVILSDPASFDAENFKVLRAQILFPRGGKPRPRVIMVTSSSPGEGKTFVAANLAASIALGIDEHVLAIDCDLRRPHLHRMFGRERSEGLHEFLTGRKELSDLIIRTQVRKLSILTAGLPSSNPSELLSSGRMEEFLNEVRERYDDRFIVIDSTPSQFTAETQVLARHVDGVVLVVMAQKTPRDGVQQAISHLGREKILGVVFNGHNEARKSRYQYYYREDRHEQAEKEERKPLAPPRPKREKAVRRKTDSPPGRFRSTRAGVTIVVVVVFLAIAGLLYREGSFTPVTRDRVKTTSGKPDPLPPKSSHPQIPAQSGKTAPQGPVFRGRIAQAPPSPREEPVRAQLPPVAAEGSAQKSAPPPRADAPTLNPPSPPAPAPEAADIPPDRKEAQVRASSAAPTHAPPKATPAPSKPASAPHGASSAGGKTPAAKDVGATSYPISLYLGSFNTPAQVKRAVEIYQQKKVHPFWVKVNLGEKGVWWRLYTGLFENDVKAEIFRGEFGLSEAAARKTPFTVEVGSFLSLTELELKRTRLETQGYSSYATREKGGYRLLVGAYTTREAAGKEAETLRSLGFQAEMAER